MKAPNGAPLVGTLERLLGDADITWNEDGTYDYTGTTVVDWDGQETVTYGGQTVFVDDLGNHWLERQLITDDAEPLTDIQPWYTNPELRRIEIENTLVALFERITGRRINIQDQSRFDSAYFREAVMRFESAVGANR